MSITTLIRNIIHSNNNVKYFLFEKNSLQYTRAMNAVKLDRVFAKPFIGSLTGHSDGVWCTCTNPKSLVILAFLFLYDQVQFVSGSCDGEVRIWDLPSQRTVFSVQAHSRFVRGVVCDPTGTTFYTCSDDKTIKRFRLAMDISNVFIIFHCFNYIARNST